VSLSLYFSLVCTLFPDSHTRFSPLLLRRDATEHSSTRPRFSTHNLLIVFNVCIQIANKLGNQKKKVAVGHVAWGRVVMIGRGNRCTRRKPATVLLCLPQIPYDPARARTRLSMQSLHRTFCLSTIRTFTFLSPPVSNEILKVIRTFSSSHYAAETSQALEVARRAVLAAPAVFRFVGDEKLRNCRVTERDPKFIKGEHVALFSVYRPR
jgi:hypothetical protein